MSFLKVLEKSGIIQMLRGRLKTEEERIAFDQYLENEVKQYSEVYEDLNAKVMQYKSDVEKLNGEQNTEHRQRKGEDLSES